MIILVCSWLRRVGNAWQGVSIYFIAVKKCLVIIMSFLTKPRYQHQQRYRLLTKITWSPFSFGPNILIRSSLLREVLVEQAPHPHSNQLFLGGKKPQYSAPHPPVLPSIHTPVGPLHKTWSVPNKQPLLLPTQPPSPIHNQVLKMSHHVL